MSNRAWTAALLAATMIAGPAMAQQVAAPGAIKPKPVQAPGEVSRNAPINGVLTLFGNERCPTDNQGNEIVVCVRRGAEEQFRVPKELRELQVTPENESWAARATGTLNEGTGVNSIGSCSAVGAGGATGCFAQRVRENRAANAQRQRDETPRNP
ncbi:hypothetical protein [Sphingomonas sanguinis]|jgi:hypothetical protein|uniref:Uncharacterized protein n=1 Tax=Sphingomonas sanguinis TaxID=33051 RepID=A0A7Y7QW67_9SPHN|nr:hypothetical protein [Sphingomonas sanguinis]MBZ6382498.1 hypothetical protein [Sphingomonas sanguinis]NNG49861.1 hypothetical protein [Sphingomonas sanguinis]NNG54817.1 hypothetical protein [Sphingomonas sanguinis]NVP31796.1 hypothetical protein [Sphingomonas sanguinis]